MYGPGPSPTHVDRFNVAILRWTRGFHVRCEAQSRTHRLFQYTSEKRVASLSIELCQGPDDHLTFKCHAREIPEPRNEPTSASCPHFPKKPLAEAHLPHKWRVDGNHRLSRPFVTSTFSQMGKKGQRSFVGNPHVVSKEGSASCASLVIALPMSPQTSFGMAAPGNMMPWPCHFGKSGTIRFLVP